MKPHPVCSSIVKQNQSCLNVYKLLQWRLLQSFAFYSSRLSDTLPGNQELHWFLNRMESLAHNVDTIVKAGLSGILSSHCASLASNKIWPFCCCSFSRCKDTTRCRSALRRCLKSLPCSPILNQTSIQNVFSTLRLRKTYCWLAAIFGKSWLAGCVLTWRAVWQSQS